MLIAYSFESVLALCKAGETHKRIHTSASTHNLAQTFNFMVFMTVMEEIKLLYGFKTILSKFCKTVATLRVVTTSEL